MASFYEPAQPSLVPLFRLLDEWDRASQQTQEQPQAQACKQARRQPCPAHAQNKRPQPQAQTQPSKKQVRPIQRFTPRFDVRETEAAYELYGELPGAARENINIEFTEPQTIVISGKVERRATPVAVPVVPQIEAAPQPAAEEERPRSPYQATVEDTDDEEFETLSNKEVAVVEAEAQKTEDTQHEEEQGRYLLQERSVGEFSRIFNLPARVDCDAVSASLENGILTVIVPKQAKHVPRTVSIN
ncbi:small heat shock protein [Cladorrhinum samala]|uniref:Small heat shock protein n=1 Tax=Cladorrhinum samala TaxID=585594 RepID=A0AAV9HG76_9PEZI|nr:small heat shock protein [Cladorrhinum samala]